MTLKFCPRHLGVILRVWSKFQLNRMNTRYKIAGVAKLSPIFIAGKTFDPLGIQYSSLHFYVANDLKFMLHMVAQRFESCALFVGSITQAKKV